jgi:chromosome segregation ATPase
MEFEQIIKRMDWLDEEHRKEKTVLSQIVERLAGFESSFNVINQQTKELTKDLSSISSTSARIDQFDDAVKNYRNELIQRIEKSEKQFTKTQNDLDKRHRLEFDGINQSLEVLQKASDTTELKRKLELRIQEEHRVSKILAELEAKISQAIKANNDNLLTTKLCEENQRQDVKKITDIQSDQVTLRKRIEEVRNSIALYPDNLRRIETRMEEIVTSETERRQSQKSFVDKQSLLQIDRDQLQKELKDKVEKMGRQSQLLETQLQEWDSVQRSVKRAQEVYEEITQKFERRINEITEMQRLAEDRFRQEWVTFKADYQKRWTSYTLTQDEQFRDTKVEIKKLSERISPVEDISQTQQDIIQQTKEANEEYLHGLLAQIHELLSAYERIMGQTRQAG